MKESLHTFVYAAALGAVCAALLTGVGRFTAPYREANAKAEKVRNILAVLQVPFDPGSSSKELLKMFERVVRVEERGALTLYVYRDQQSDKGVLAVAVPFAGQGLWGPIKGFLALEPDMRTIRGVAFHQQEETPGLGGEIVSAWFRDQFKGKSIESAQGEPGVRLVQGGKGLAQNEVDAITGATMTSQRVQKMLNATIALVVKQKQGGADVH